MPRPVRVAVLGLLALACLPGAAAVPPKVGAQAYVLLEVLTGEVIAAKNPDETLPPASLVKLMTAYLAFAAVKAGAVVLDETVRVSPAARAASGSRMFLEVNSEVSFRNLLLGLIVQSGNDAAVSIAERLSGSEEAFVKRMNQQARTLGMTNTTYATATGLPSTGQVSTARDLAVLARALVTEFPELYKFHAVREYEHNGILQRNRNRLLDEYRGTDGIKTGYTRRAGYCLAASARRHGMRLVGVLLKAASARSRNREMEKLLDFGYDNFRAVELFVPGQSLDAVKVWGGASDRVEVGYGAEEPLRLLLTRTQANDLRAVLKGTGTLVEAPVAVGDEIARIEVLAGEQVLASLPAVALAAVATGPWWQRLVDYVRLHWLAPAAVGQDEG